MFKWLFGHKKLEDVLNERKKIRVRGVDFVIRKVSPIHYMNGSRILARAYEVYKTSATQGKENEFSQKAVVQYYSELFCAAIVEPELSMKANVEGKLFVEHLMTDWGLASEIHDEIFAYTYGKKKLRRSLSLARSLPNAT